MTGGQDGVRTGKSEPVTAEGPQPGLFSQVKEKAVSKWDFLAEVGHRGFLGAGTTQVWSRCSVRGLWQDLDWEPGLLPDGVIRLPPPRPARHGAPGRSPGWAGPCLLATLEAGSEQPGNLFKYSKESLTGCSRSAFQGHLLTPPTSAAQKQESEHRRACPVDQSATEEDGSTEPGGAS